MGALVPLAEGDLELIEILGAQLSERLAGLDQQPCRDEAARAAGDGVGEPELAGRRNEPLDVVAQRARGQLSPERDELARDEVVVAGTQMPCSIRNVTSILVRVLAASRTSSGSAAHSAGWGQRSKKHSAARS